MIIQEEDDQQQSELCQAILDILYTTEVFFSFYSRKCAYLSFENSTPLQLTSAQLSWFRHWQFENNKIEAFFNTITQFTNARIIHCGFYKWKTLDDEQKNVIPQLAIDTEVFHRVFANPCTL